MAESSITPQPLSKPKIAERADFLNADAIFVIKKIRAAKQLSELIFHSTEYETIRISLIALLEEISLHSMRNSLHMRTLTKRLKYALDFMRREYLSKTQKLQRAAKAESQQAAATKRSASSAISAKLLARFIINESIRLNLSKPPIEESIYLSHRVSEVRDSDMKPTSELIASLTGEPELLDKLTQEHNQNVLQSVDVEDINPLEGIDESL